jgi:hypothetical protein
MVKALTHHHWKFLKQAYKHEVDLVNDERYLKVGDRFIRFLIDTERFVVCIKTMDGSIPVRSYTKITAAINAAQRV